jgi:hypothetical protein
MAQNTNADLPLPPPVDTSKDMSKATRQVLGNIANLLQNAPPVSPRGADRQSRATQPESVPRESASNRKPERAARTASTDRR